MEVTTSNEQPHGENDRSRAAILDRTRSGGDKLRAFVSDHPWLVLGSAIGAGIGLGYGSRRLDRDVVSRVADSARSAGPGIGALIGSVLLRAGITAALQRFGDRT